MVRFDFCAKPIILLVFCLFARGGFLERHSLFIFFVSFLLCGGGACGRRALISADSRFYWFLLVCQGGFLERISFFIFFVSFLLCGGERVGRALISTDIRFYWFLLQFLTQPQRKDKVQSTSRDLCVAPSGRKPHRQIQKKKKKKKPGEIPSRKREEHTHTNPYLYFILVLLKKSNFC